MGAGMKVFVYGTLKRGYGNNRLLRNSRFLGEKTVGGYTLYAVAGFPGAVREPGAFVNGEVYEVDEYTLENLDGLEGVPHMYQRFQATTDDDLTVWIYVWNGPIADGWGRLGPDWPGFEPETYSALQRMCREGAMMGRFGV